jgi:hypothetical protein
MVKLDVEYGFNVEDDTPTYVQACMGLLVCPHCSKAVMCGDIQPNKVVITEENKMLPSGDSQQQQSNQKRGRGQQQGLPRLDNSMLSRQPKEAKILMVKQVEGQYGLQVALKLAFEGQATMWYVKADRKKNPNYGLLLDKFGPDENDWVGQVILLKLEQDDFTEQFFARVSFPAEAKGKR